MPRLWNRVEGITDRGRMRSCGCSPSKTEATRKAGAGRLVSLALAGVVLVLAVVPSASSASSIQGSLSRAAAALTGRPIIVACAPLPGLEGEADAARVWLDLGTCAPLLRSVARGPDNVYAAEAAAALTHELGHVLLGPCEYRAERYAMEHWRALYRILGLGTADSVDAAYVLSMHRALPPEYLSPAPDC